MNTRRILMGTIVLGIVANAMDWVLNKFLWPSIFASLPWINPNPQLMWLIIGDFAAAFMLMLAWDRFGSVGGRGPGAGFRFGAFAGAFISFPAVLFWQMYIKDFPYTVAWELIVVNVIFMGILGAVAAMLDGKATA